VDGVYAKQPNIERAIRVLMAFEAESDEIENATPIQYLNLSPMTINSLHRGKIETIEQLASTDDCKLLAIRGINFGRVMEIDEALKEFELVRE
jgi:DNA-directed RNA polymerase alpha subunit